jgi:hypothetical protein
MPPIAVMNLIARQLTRSLLMTVYLGAQWRPRLGSVIAAEFSACSNSHRTDETQARITSACVRQQARGHALQDACGLAAANHLRQ